MGVGGHFWDVLRPYARWEGLGWFRNKRVAVDLSYWIVQNDTALKGLARKPKPHLRLVFFRTINLFAKFGAFPVFVVDGKPSPLKSQARILRFYRASGIHLEAVSLQRNGLFNKYVHECVELLQLLGMPVLWAIGEAEALCAQLNREGHVDACITADSDAFLYGAKCVVKRLTPNSKDPLEIYYMSDIEAGLGMKRNHLIAISLLVGNDYDLNGVQGIGVDTAIRFVKAFAEDEILDKLFDIGRGDAQVIQRDTKFVVETVPVSKENLQTPKSLHCSFCGHPGSKKSHLKFDCEFCDSTLGNGCTPKAIGFKCVCSSCDLGRKIKEVEKKENWHLKICKKIASEHNFPNNEIINILLSNDHDIADDKHLMSWDRPKMDMLVNYLSYHLHWEPSYTRQRLFPMLSTIFLREVASNKTNDNLLCGQYEFNSIQRVKVRYGYRFYLVKWSKPTPSGENAVYTIPSDEPEIQESDCDQSCYLLDESDVPQIQIDNGCCFLCSDEDMELVHEAYPDKVDQFLKEKELKESKSKRKSSSRSGQIKESSESPASNGVQPSITEFYPSSKVNRTFVELESPVNNVEKGLGSSSKGKRKEQTPKYSKSLRRRRLLF